MPKLILEYAGERRAFQVSPGRLSVGSGERATLRIESAQLAEIHADLEVREDGLVVRPRPGVNPPRIDGVAMAGEQRLAAGRAVEIGDARIYLEGPAVQAAGVAAPAASAANRPAGGVRPAAGAPRRSVVTTRRRSTQRSGIPGWLTAVLALGVAVVAVFVLMRAFQTTLEQGSLSVEGTLAAAEGEMRGGTHLAATTILDRIPGDADLTPAQRTRLDGLRKAIAASESRDKRSVSNLAGHEFLDLRLKGYESKYLGGDPEPARVRFFLKRCREFRGKWPGHPELGWVERQEARFRGLVDLNDAPTLEDVSWEVHMLVDGRPRDYATAFRLLDAFEDSCRGGECEQIAQMRAEMITERAEYHQDRLFEAEYRYNKKDDPGQAVFWLVESVTGLGDRGMENEAAEYLVKIPEFAGMLRTYRKDRPDKFSRLLANEIVAEFAEREGIR